MSVIEWFCDRSACCAELRSEVSLYERQAVVMVESLEALRADRDGLCRELWMARRSYDDLKVSAARDYRHLSAATELLRSRLEHAERMISEQKEAKEAAEGQVV